MFSINLVLVGIVLNRREEDRAASHCPEPRSTSNVPRRTVIPTTPFLKLNCQRRRAGSSQTPTCLSGKCSQLSCTRLLIASCTGGIACSTRTEDWQIHKDTAGVTCHQNHHDCCAVRLRTSER